VFDVVGRRKWFYAFSLAITVPGLLFIFLTLIPNGKMGLQFSIAYKRPAPSGPSSSRTVRPNQLTSSRCWLDNGLPDARGPHDDHERHPIHAHPDRSTGPERGWRCLQRLVAGPRRERARLARRPWPRPRRPRPQHRPDGGASVAGGICHRGCRAGRLTSRRRRHHVVVAGKLKEVQPALEAAFGPIAQTLELTSVGPVVSAELIQQTFLLILMGAVGIMLWITYRFRDFRMGPSRLVALLHDVIVVVCVFAILGTFARLQIDALFVTAMLTVIGFSVHDTIWCRPGAREPGAPFRRELRRHRQPQHPPDRGPVDQHLAGPWWFTLLALFMFGGAAIHSFVLALLIGIISGTYSSVANASPLLVDWHLWDERRRRREMAKQAKPQARLA